MSISQENKDYLYDMLEKIILDKNDLGILKTDIDKVSTGEISPKKFRKQIFDNRISFIERIIEFAPYYVKRKGNIKSLDEFTREKEDPKLDEELIKKKKLIEEIGLRVNKIVKKLKSQ